MALYALVPQSIANGAVEAEPEPGSSAGMTKSTLSLSPSVFAVGVTKEQLQTRYGNLSLLFDRVSFGKARVTSIGTHIWR